VNLAELRLEHVRCLSRAELTLHPRLNLITGANGAGKTSLLEAVYLLGRGRSFRTRHTEQLIQGGTEGLWVAAGLVAGAAVRMDLQCHKRDGVVARIDGRPVTSFAELSEVLPVQVIEPGIHRLIEEGPARRRWLDWAVFHVEPGFVGQWQGYMRSLRQRNAALRGAGEGDPLPWEVQLAGLGEALTAARARVLEAVQPYLQEMLDALDAAPATWGFEPGWPSAVPLGTQLARQRERDRQRGYTGPGPHRFDVAIRMGGRPAREVISRGQQKVLGAAMTVALAHYLARAAGRPPTLLLDDPAAELDAAHTERLMSAVLALGSQCVVTVLKPESLPAAMPDRVFHVEHGGVKQL